MKLKAFTVSAALSLAALAAPAHAAITAVGNGTNGAPMAGGLNGNYAFMDALVTKGAFKDTYTFTLTKPGTERVNLSFFGAGFKSLMATLNGTVIKFTQQSSGDFYGVLSKTVTPGTQTLMVSGVGATSATLSNPSSYSGNLRFTGAVPEPASWALMIMGLGVAGTVRRRRTATAANLA